MRPMGMNVRLAAVLGLMGLLFVPPASALVSLIRVLPSHTIPQLGGRYF